MRGFTEILNHIGIPERIFHDNEGAWNSSKFISLLNKHHIKQIITTSLAPFAERAVQEMKNMIHKRIQGLNMKHEEWVDLVPNVLKQYNNRTHGTTGMTPNEARQKKNELQVYLNIRQRATFKRRYPPLKVCDSVKTRVKPHTFQKGFHSAWSTQIYKITFIDDDLYLLDDKATRRRPWARHDLLKVESDD